jgi:hypothetical protein
MKKTIPIPRAVLDAQAMDLVAKVRLSILIWGPGRSGGALYVKRCDIRDLLMEEGHDVHFSEEVWTPETLIRSGLNVSVAEFIQATKVDYIICLMTSPGPIGEVHDFARNKKIAAKMMICIDSCHKRGYNAKGVIRIFEGYNGKVDWFKNPKDIRDCHLATRIIDHVRKVAEAKQWELAIGSVS